MNRLFFSLPTVVALVAVGCGASQPAPKSAEAAEAMSPSAGSSPDPNAVCVHTEKVLDAEMPTAKTEKERESAHADCVRDGDARKTADPSGWSCWGDCALSADTFASLRACDQKCPKK